MLDYLARGDEAAIAAEEERKKTPVVTGSQVAFTDLNRALIQPDSRNRASREP